MRRWLIVPDLHSPYHDDRAWRLMLKVARSLGVYGVVVLGDFGEFSAVSTHRPNPQHASRLALEVESVRHCREDLESLGPKRKVFILGNHEDRLFRYVMDRAPAFYGLVDVEDVLGLSKWEVVPYKDSININGTTFTHDLERAGRYAAHQALTECGGNIVIGHLHRFDYAVEGTSDGHSRFALCPGWLGDWRQQNYKHRIKARREWQLGFALGYETKTGFSVAPVPIVDYACVAEGQRFSG